MLSVGIFASFAMLYVGIGSINSIKKAQSFMWSELCDRRDTKRLVYIAFYS